MIIYNPKDWWQLDFAFLKSNTYRKLLLSMIGVILSFFYSVRDSSQQYLVAEINNLRQIQKDLMKSSFSVNYVFFNTIVLSDVQFLASKIGVFNALYNRLVINSINLLKLHFIKISPYNKCIF